ncbi:Hypothetical protein SMAX5B_009698, partial [Scophthalmus maximus]
GDANPPDRTALHNKTPGPPPAPAPPSRPASTVQGAAVIVHLYWRGPAAAARSWQR